MKEIHIANVIVNMRKEKGITQDELAAYIGVSKASVSKWETGQSYPDITFLPLLAAHFNISIDDLMGYEPQMTKEDIRKLYHKLADDFASKPFDEVLSHCREIAKKYFSCFPLLFQIGVLLINYSAMARDAEKTAAVMAEAKELFVRVKNECGDAELARHAVTVEAICSLALGKPDEVLELLAGQLQPLDSPPEALLASAYQMTGNTKEAKYVLQVGVYQHMQALFRLLSASLPLCGDEPEKYEEIYRRGLAVADTFHIKRLNPYVLIPFYINAAQGYLENGHTEKALDILQTYAEFATGEIYPLRLKGDDFFTLLDKWFAEFPLGSALPRDEKTIRKTITDILTNNPKFSVLADECRFKNIVKKLKNNVREKL